MGRYDPPNKKELLAQFRRMPSTPELMVESVLAAFPPKVQATDDATCARLTDATHSAAPHTQPHAVACQPPKRGRKPVVTPEKVQMICELLAHGESERSACLRAGISLTSWSTAKRADANLHERIASARDDWARLRHAQHAAALYESQSARDASRKVLKPRPTKQANAVVWHLVARVPLNFAAIPEEEIVSACKRVNMHLETWQRQDRAFGLMRKVYAKRAAIRGQQPRQAFQWNDWPEQ